MMRITRLTKSVLVMALALLLPLSAFSMFYYRPLFAPVYLEPSDSIDDFVEQLETKISALLETNTIPGAAIAVISNNQTNIITAGRSNLFTNEPLTPHYVFQIASMSKSQCALAIMKLVQDGLILLDAPVEWYLTGWSFPDSQYNTSGVTVRRLLCHAAGISLEGVSGGFNPYDVSAIENALTEAGVSLIYEPGSVFSYSGGGYGILQLLIEEVSGMSYDEYLQSEVFEPLNMSDTTTGWESSIEDHLAVGYSNMLLPIIRTYPAIKAAAGHYSSIEDMAKWVNQLLHGQPIVNTTNMLAMYTPQWGESWGWSLGFNYKLLSNGVFTLGHGGDNWGYHGAYRFAPESGEAIIVLTNGDRGAAFVTELLHHWETVIEGGDLEILWEDKNQAYGQTLLYESITIVGFLALLLLAWYRGLIAFFPNSEKGESGGSKWFRRIVSVLCVFVIIIFFIYWGYTPLSPISYGPISYVWTVIAPLIWLTWTAVAFQQFNLVSERIPLKAT
jgi:CubicO group peptidase (beta-lactamase class C family)